MAVLFHEKYKAYPEVWRRPQGGKGEGKAIGCSALAALLTPVAFVLFCAWIGLTTMDRTLALAAAVWIMGPVPVLVGNYLFLKLHSLNLVSHLSGWLVKLLVTAALVAWILE
jgi:glycerol-3-phosphate acyltransferase PlsY